MSAQPNEIQKMLQSGASDREIVEQIILHTQVSKATAIEILAREKGEPVDDDVDGEPRP